MRGKDKKDENAISPLSSPPPTPGRSSQPEESKPKDKNEKKKEDKKEKDKEKDKKKDEEKEEKRPFEHRFLSQLTIRGKKTQGLPRNDGSFFQEQQQLAKEKEEKEKQKEDQSKETSPALVGEGSPTIAPSPSSVGSTPSSPLQTNHDNHPVDSEKKLENNLEKENNNSSPKVGFASGTKEEPLSPKKEKGLGFRTFSIKRIKHSMTGKSEKEEKHTKSEKKDEKKEEKKEDKKDNKKETTTAAAETKAHPVIPVRSVSQDPEVLREAKAVALQFSPSKEDASVDDHPQHEPPLQTSPSGKCKR